MVSEIGGRNSVFPYILQYSTVLYCTVFSHFRDGGYLSR